MLGAVLEQLTNGPKAKNLKVSFQQNLSFPTVETVDFFILPSIATYLLGPSFNVLLDYLQ
jgi:hypothetical protein